MKIQDIDEVLTWGLNELWNAAQQINEECNGKLTKQLEKINNGIHIKIPIYYITEEWYDIYPTGQSVNIYGYNKISIHNFMKDKMEREKQLRKIIYENQPDESVLEPR